LWGMYTGVPGGKIHILEGHSIHSKKKFVYTYVLFRTVSQIELFHCTVPKLLIRKRYYGLFLIPVFIVQVITLVQFIQYNTFSKIPPSTSVHFAACVRTAHSIFCICEMCGIFHNTPEMSLSTVTTANWRFTSIHLREGRTVFGAKSKLLYSEIALSRKPFAIGHMYIYRFVLRMTGTMTSQNVDLSSWAPCIWKYITNPTVLFLNEKNWIETVGFTRFLGFGHLPMF
jgi:hypothetical protein